MAISTTQARALLTSAFVALYKEAPKPTSFLRSFFVDKISTDRYVSIEVQRGSEKFAVDVKRGTNGNSNKVSQSTEKVISPPYYNEFFGANDLRLYDVAIGNASASNLRALGQAMAEEAMIVRDKIERSYEKQAADVFETGVVTLNDGSIVDFGRKASMIEDLSGAPWSNNANDPVADIKAACVKLRTIGKAQGGFFNMIVGGDALDALLNNTKFQAKANLRDVDLMKIELGAMTPTGATPHGMLTAGSFKVIVWTYPQYYDVAGVSTPYINEKKFVLLPPNPTFYGGYAGVPQIIKDGKVAQNGKYMVSEFLNEEAKSHRVYTESAGIMIPVAVDQIYTGQVLA
jgi:hypothetical protein